MFSRAKTFQQPTARTPQFLTIRMNKPSYFVDEYIDGKIEVNSAVPIVIDDISLSLTLLANWTTNSTEKGQIGDTYTEALVKKNLEVRKQLNINSNLVSLAAGKFTFPFYFKLPKGVAPCFEYATSDTNASIRYSLDANVISPYIQGRTSSYVLLKSRPNLQPKNLKFQVSSNIHKWGLFDAGSTIFNIVLNTGTDSFVGNENINMNILIDNTSGKLIADEVKFTLNRTLLLKSKYGKVSKELKNDCIVKKCKVLTNVKEKKTFPFTFPLKDFDNTMLNYSKAKLPYANIKDYNYFLKSVNSLIIECKYTLKGTLYFNKFVKYDDRPRIIIPLNICHQSVKDYNTEIQNYYNSQNQNNNQINNQINNNNQYNNNQINNSQIYNNQYNNNQINNNNPNNINSNPLYRSVSLNNNNPPPNAFPQNPNNINNINNNPPPNAFPQNPNNINNINNNPPPNAFHQNPNNINNINNVNNNPPRPNENNYININSNDDLDLPSQAEIEKHPEGEPENLGAPAGFDAPPPFFPPNP